MSVGLSANEVANRQRAYGFSNFVSMADSYVGKNEVPAPPGTPLWELILEQFKVNVFLLPLIN